MFSAIIWYIETCQEAAAEKQIVAYLLVTGDRRSAQSRAGKTAPWALACWVTLGAQQAGPRHKDPERGGSFLTACRSLIYPAYWTYGFPGRSSVKNAPANSRDMVRSLVQEDPLEKDIATHFGILPWKILWTEEPGGLHTVHEVPKESLLSNWTTTTTYLV